MKQTNRHGIQIHYRIYAKKGAAVAPPSHDAIQRIYQAWIETGKTPRAIKITATMWGEKVTQAQARARLKELRITRSCPGIVEQYGAADLTLTDYDTPKIPSVVQVENLARHLNIQPLCIRDDRTRRGWHRTIKWSRKFTPGEIVALQLLLGSDPSREMFNLLRVLSGQAVENKRWNLLFSKKL